MWWCITDKSWHMMFNHSNWALSYIAFRNSCCTCLWQSEILKKENNTKKLDIVTNALSCLDILLLCCQHQQLVSSTQNFHQNEWKSCRKCSKAGNIRDWPNTPGSTSLEASCGGCVFTDNSIGCAGHSWVSDIVCWRGFLPNKMHCSYIVLVHYWVH